MLRTRMILRSLVIVAAIFSWLAVSNHCALAAISATPNATENCPMHPQPAKQKNDSGLICCKILRAPSAPAMVKAAAPVQLPDLFLGDLWTALTSRDALEAPAPAIGCDTGPPGLGSYAELVLQRSLLAHAPPSLG